MHLLCVAALSFAGTDFLCRNVAAQTAPASAPRRFTLAIECKRPDRVRFRGTPSAGHFAGNQAANAVGSISDGPVRVDECGGGKSISTVATAAGSPSGNCTTERAYRYSDSNTGVSSRIANNGSFVSVNPRTEAPLVRRDCFAGNGHK